MAVLRLPRCSGFPLAVDSGRCSLAAACRPLVAVASLRWSSGSRTCGLPQLWHRGSVAPQHVGFSWIRDQTHVSCIGRRVLYHCAAREASLFDLFCFNIIYNVSCLLSQFSRVLLFVDPMDCTLPGSSVHEKFPGNTRMDCHALLQGISLTQGSNPHLIVSWVGRWVLYHYTMFMWFRMQTLFFLNIYILLKYS